MQSEEIAFIKPYLENLSTRSVRYGADYMEHTLPSPLRIKRVPVFLPVNKESNAAETSLNTTPDYSTEPKIEIIIKVLKPSNQFKIESLTVKNTVADLKNRIHQQRSFQTSHQRLLVKGKALADDKSLEELGIKDGAIIHLSLKAAPASTTSISPEIGRFGVTAETEKKLTSPEFWSAIEKTVLEQVGEADTKLLISKIKSSLSA